MDLSSLIAKIKPQTASGSIASNRFDFQKNWGICKLVDLHEKDDDYLILFEWFDDIAVINNPKTKKANIGFYQIKSKSNGNWTLGELIRKKKGSLSCLGKIYTHVINFDKHIESLNFVSNAKFSFKLKGDSKNGIYSKVTLSKINQADIDKIHNELKGEHGSQYRNPNFLDFTFLILTNCGIETHEDVAKNKLNNLLEKKSHGKAFRLNPAFSTLCKEIIRKSNYEKNDIHNLESLSEKRGISKTEFEEILNSILKQFEDPQATINSIEGQLQSEKADFGLIKEFLDNSRMYYAEKYNQAEIFIEIQNVIKKIIKNAKFTKTISLKERLEHVFKEYTKKQAGLCHNYTDGFVKSLILFLLYEK